ncbi:MAG: Ig-like domain-containing protein, partial [Phycisphaerae bacterium]
MSRKKKNLRAKALERKNRKCGVHSERHASSPASPSLRIETLEPRILLSATWVDSDTGDPLEGATAGNDTYTGTEGNDVADGLGGDDTLFGQDGNDTLHGNSGQDSLFGEAGDDELYGGPDNDTLDGGEGTDAVNYSDATASVTVDLTTGTATGGGGDDTLTSIEGVIGSDYDDTFAFSNPSDGATYTVDGGGGTNTIDLSAFTDNQINDDGSTITVEPGGGQSFTVNYSNVENITTAEGTYNPGGIPAGNNAPDAVDDAVSTTEDTAVTTGNVLANDTDPEGDTLSVTGFTQGANGTVVDNGDGTFTYTPNADFSGTDSFTYTVDDGN